MTATKETVTLDAEHYALLMGLARACAAVAATPKMRSRQLDTIDQEAVRSTATTTRREWSVLRPADSDFLPLTPIGPTFCSTFDEGYARQAAVRTYSDDVLAECPLAWCDVTETEFTVVGLALSAEKEQGR